MLEGNQLLYERLVKDIQDHIERHALMPGDRLPSMNELCLQFGVSHMTVRAAIKILTESGVLESRQRQGIFVSQARDRKPSLSGEKMLAVLVPHGDHPYEAGIIRGVMEQSHKVGYRVIIVNSNDSAEKEASQLRELAQQVAGLIVFPSFDSGNYATYASLLEQGTPWVFVDRSVPGLSVPLVATDNEHGGYLATRHLLEQGCRRVYAINARIVSSTQERLQGHHRALKEWGIPNAREFVRHSSTHTHHVGYTFTKEILRDRQPGEQIGIFALDENLARSCYTALKEAGVRIPDDVAVVGYDDMAAAFFDPPLSAVRQEPYRMGSMAVQTLLERMRDKKAGAREVRLKPELVVRSSSDADSEFSWINNTEPATSAVVAAI